MTHYYDHFWTQVCSGRKLRLLNMQGNMRCRVNYKSSFQKISEAGRDHPKDLANIIANNQIFTTTHNNKT